MSLEEEHVLLAVVALHAVLPGPLLARDHLPPNKFKPNKLKPPIKELKIVKIVYYTKQHCSNPARNNQ